MEYYILAVVNFFLVGKNTEKRTRKKLGSPKINFFCDFPIKPYFFVTKNRTKNYFDRFFKNRLKPLGKELK